MTALFSTRLATIGTIGLFVIILMAIFAPFLTSYAPTTMFTNGVLEAPSRQTGVIHSEPITSDRISSPRFFMAPVSA